MSETYEKNVAKILLRFAALPSPEERYSALIDMGRSLPPLASHLKTPENLVAGCQSNLYLHAHLDQGRIYFSASSDALISLGLAALLIAAYSGEAPSTILTSPPDFLDKLGIHASLSPNRSNGLTHIHLRMKQSALKIYMLQAKS